jgi:ribosomal protein L11 methyltransferase
LEDDPANPEICRVQAYYPETYAEPELVADLQTYLTALPQCDVAIGDGTVNVKRIKDADWSSNWKDHFKPFRVGQHLIIKPSWEQYAVQPDDLILEIDPGMAFGTGLHASTRLVLTLLEQQNCQNARVLDVGTGSGILSIAAARLGAQTVVGVDHDAEALAIAQANVAHNALADRIIMLVGSPEYLALDIPFDYVLMNIRPKTILELIPAVARLLQPGGLYIVSGMLTAEGAEFVQQLPPLNLVVQNQLIENDWIAYVLQVAS